MSNPRFCLNDTDWRETRKRYQKRKLNFMILMKEAQERRLSAINAAISTLENQIESTDDNSNNHN